MKNNKNDQQRKYKKSSLAVVIAAMSSINLAQALQQMTDSEMGLIDAQDGLYINAEYDSATIGRVFWQDKAGLSNNTETTLGAYFDNVSLAPTGASHSTDVSHTTKLHTTLNLDIGSSGSATGVALQSNIYFGTLKMDSLKICDSAGAICGDSYGSFAVQSQEDVIFNLNTRDGLFNKNALVDMTLGIKNLNLYFTQKDSGGINNQVIAKDFNFNFTGKGYIYIGDSTESNPSYRDALVLETRDAANYIDLNKVDDINFAGKSKAGLNLDFVYKDNSGTSLTTVGAKGVLHLGVSGRATNAGLVFKGVDGRNATPANSILGAAYSASGTAATTIDGSVAGSQGLYMRMKADFAKDQADADTFGAGGTGVTLELAHGGTNAYGIEFSNLSPLLIRKTVAAGGTPLNTDRASFDSGDVYINLINSKKVQMPTNTVLNTSRLTVNSVTDFITPTADYSHLVHDSTVANPNALAIAVRDFNFNAVARSSRFIVSNDVTNPADIPSTASTEWGIGLPIYNLQANLVTYGTTVAGNERLGFALGLSTKGSNSDGDALTTTDGDKTTSIILIDGAANPLDGNNPSNYYLGLRNIDMLITAYGTLGLENSKINVNMPKLTIAGAMELAAGYLPGSRYRSNFMGCAANEVACYAPVDSFTKKDDVYLGVKLKLDGSMNLDIVPGADTLAGNRLSFEGNYDLKGNVTESGVEYTTSAIQLVDPIDGSILGLDNLTGNIGFNNQIKINKDTVSFSYAFTFNPDQLQDKVFRVRDINLYPPTGNGQRLGEMVITGGSLVSNMTIKPRN